MHSYSGKLPYWGSPLCTRPFGLFSTKVGTGKLFDVAASKQARRNNPEQVVYFGETGISYLSFCIQMTQTLNWVIKTFEESETYNYFFFNPPPIISLIMSVFIVLLDTDKVFCAKRSIQI